MLRIGLISDTHGLLRPEALAFLRGSDCIVHGGDIGNEGILDTLRAIAPLTVVRGNNDTADWARDIPESAHMQLDAGTVYVLHNLAQLGIDPVREGVRVVVSGHSHRPLVREEDGVLYINPGSAGPRRFKLPITVGELMVADGAISSRIVELSAGR
ncbi:MAG: Putative phosphoesterase [uncultured Lysobacter sp.]|uniref:Phosphoesterase n=1 Tax=uncultured Lysobacter sp. TaxID=271060 RepID=A0A6J4KFA6_9GAMM|nr:MAG: Putative phosphoesterase [uncultured Lysobacter sp.]